MWKDSGLYYNKATKAFDSDRECASIVDGMELEMIQYKYDDEVRAISI
jgi:zona occludens toxin (predicted ATPase)